MPPSRSNHLREIPLEHHVQLLEAVEQNPHVTQADLAAQLGVAVGTVNWYLKRMISKGYVKIRQLQRRRLLYLVTPRGIAEKSRLGVEYLQWSLEVYRRTRAQAREAVRQVRRAGYNEMVINVPGDLAEICRLTCLEHGVRVAKPMRDGALPSLQMDGTRIKLTLPAQGGAHK